MQFHEDWILVLKAVEIFYWGIYNISSRTKYHVVCEVACVPSSIESYYKILNVFSR